MSSIVTVVAKTVCGGALVLVFAGLAETIKPKRFAGILGAAPSVALAGLVIGDLEKGPTEQALSAHTMIAGAVGLVVYCLVAVPALRRFGAGWGAGLAGLGWLAAAALVYEVIAP